MSEEQAAEEVAEEAAAEPTEEPKEEVSTDDGSRDKYRLIAGEEISRTAWLAQAPWPSWACMCLEDWSSAFTCYLPTDSIQPMMPPFC